MPSRFHTLAVRFTCCSVSLPWTSLVAPQVKNPVIQKTWVQSLGWEDGKGYPLQSGLENRGHKESDTTEPLSLSLSVSLQGLPRWRCGKESACQCRRYGLDPWVGKIPWGKKQQPTPVVLPGISHGQGSLVDCGPWGHKESGRTQQLSTLYCSGIFGCVCMCLLCF